MSTCRRPLMLCALVLAAAVALVGCGRRAVPVPGPAPAPEPQEPTTLGKVLFLVDEGVRWSGASDDDEDPPTWHALYLVELPPGGSSATPAWRGPGVYWYDEPPGPVWSADGRAALGGWVTCPEMAPELLLILPGPGAEAVYETEASPYDCLAWHPTLPLLAYGALNGDLVVLDAEKGAMVNLMPAMKAEGEEGVNLQARWMPDGDGFVFVQGDADWQAPYTLVVGYHDAGDVMDLTPAESEYSEYSPLPSPDGKWIAFSRVDGLWVMDAQGRRRRQLTRVPHPDEAPGFPPVQDANTTDYAHSWREDSGAVYFEGTSQIEADSPAGLVDPVTGLRAVEPVETGDGRYVGWTRHGGMVELSTGEITSLGHRLPDERRGQAAVTGGPGWRVALEDGALWLVREAGDERTLIFRAERGEVTRFSVWDRAGR